MFDWQFYITFCAIFLAIGYAVWRIYRVVRGDADPCSDCELKKNCKKFGQSKEK
jgi:hypothetical protein